MPPRGRRRDPACDLLSDRGSVAAARSLTGSEIPMRRLSVWRCAPRAAGARRRADAHVGTDPPSLPWPRRAASVERTAATLDQRRFARLDRHAVDDRLDLLRRTIELVVGEDRRALEGQVARDLQPRLAAVEVVADLDRDGARDAIGAQQQDVQRVA